MADRARRPRARRAVVVILVIAAAAALVWFAVHLAGRDPSGGPGGRRGGRPSATVGFAVAKREDVPVTLDALGTVTPAATVTVSPQVSGVITQVLFREGQMVAKGQALAVIDPRPLQMALMEAQGALTRDEAQLANARLLLKRQQTLLAQDSIARQDVDTQAALVKQLEGTVMTDRAAVGTARINLGYSRVTAPVSGRAGLRVVDVGNYVAVGATGGLVVITQVNPIDVEFTVPQDAVPQIQTQAAKGALPVTAFDRTKTQVLDQGTFSTLDNQVDTTTGTVKAKARFPNAQGTMFPNQFVNARIALQTLKGVVVVPVTAVRTGANGDFVWKLNADKTVSLQKVTRGPGTATSTSITTGLVPGERVITEGGDRLTDGADVQLAGDRPGAGGGGGGSGRRQALMKACAADLKANCADKTGREAMACLRQNADKLAPSCKAALAKMPRRGGGGGGAGG
jgi:multidrug efflux system membrane fusion protein